MKHSGFVFGLCLLMLLASCGTSSNTASVSQDTNLSTNTGNTMNEPLTGTVVLDLNHQLAGETLNFEVEIVKITKGDGNTEADIVQPGDTIEVHYVGTLNDGSTFDSSRERNEPLAFTVGSGQMIAGFDSGVVGMKLGETKTLTIAPEDAYGAYDETLKQTVPKSELQSFVNAGYKLEPGESLPTQFGPVKIISVSDE